MAKFSSKFDMDDIPLEKESKKEKKSKYCSKCGYENLVTSKFCAECGNDQFYDTIDEYNDVKNSKYCINCKTKLNIKIKFCPNCGKNKFVDSLNEIEQFELDSVHSYWNGVIKSKKDELARLEFQAKTLYSEKENLKKELIYINEKYQSQVEQLNSELVTSQTNFSNRSKKLEEEYDEFNIKKKELNSKIQNINKEADNKEAQLRKDITNFTNDIKKLQTENKNLLAEIEKIKKDGSFVLKKFDNYHVYIGRYDGKELLWKVLKETKTEMVLITNECIDAGRNREINIYLNKIYKEAFTAEEKQYIIGNISIHSHDEVIEYMYYKEKRLCGYNKLASSKALLRNGLISWWVKDDKVVNGKGDVIQSTAIYSSHGIRPVITVKKNK